MFVLRADLVSVEARSLLQSAARAVLLSRRGSLSEQVNRLEESELAAAPPARPSAASPGTGQGRSARRQAAAPPRPELEFFNGLGGFAADGREYVTILGEGQWTPAPWINVIANPSFGFQVSAEGGGYTWSVNSRENQLTPWSNDPVSDRPGEVIYVRDEDTGALWGPTALPIRDEAAPYVARHGQGYSRFEHTSHGISLELLQYVPLDDPIKISRLTIQQSVRAASRRLSVTAYVEWVLGASRGASAPFIVTEIDAETGALLARNPWSTEFGDRVAFADLAGRQLAWTGDRTEFLGRNGTLDHPAALAGGAPLSNRVGAGLDPCGALQTRLELEPNGAAEIVFFLGEAATQAEARALITRYRTADLDAVLRAVTGALGRRPRRGAGEDARPLHGHPAEPLAALPDARLPGLGALGLLPGERRLRLPRPAAGRDGADACRSRSSTRAHLLRAAARQFVEGDVQHWWLPPSGQGVRTRISDDRVWLPYAVAHYVEVTGDLGGARRDGSLSRRAGAARRRARLVLPAHGRPTSTATLFEHCARALDRSLSVGGHGLPLIGDGRLERRHEPGRRRRARARASGSAGSCTPRSSAFAPPGGRRAASRRAPRPGGGTRAALRESLEREAWDGDWYRRGYFDDGTPLGSASSSECRIDSIAQSWA